MALTLRSNGTGGGIIQAAWFNDFYDLLTGVMTDQAVTISNSLTVTGAVTVKGGLGVATAGTGNNWYGMLDMPVTGTTVAKNWRLIYDGSTGNLFFDDITDGKTALTMQIDGSVYLGNGNAHVDSVGNFYSNGTLHATGGFNGALATSTANVYLSFKDNAGNIEFDANAPAATARGVVFAGVDTAGTLHAGVQVNSDGSIEVGALNTSTSGVQLIKFFTGTTTPTTSAPDGSIWFKG